ncbi:1044_t:CDS:2 [Diversispora eburnea]|uniref:1044_t:CDS:1 n=1 Tax=Diversispora eburnea TaxID=1213867 RepID=A0A9N9AIJ6_9GLOM|nr:1044_t:CDS:2 [Diversispora eburnea]
MVDEQKIGIFDYDDDEQALRSPVPIHIMNVMNPTFNSQTRSSTVGSAFSIPAYGSFASQVQRETENRIRPNNLLYGLTNEPDFCPSFTPSSYITTPSLVPSPTSHILMPSFSPEFRHDNNKKNKLSEEEEDDDNDSNKVIMFDWHLRCVPFQRNSNYLSFLPDTKKWIVVDGFIKKANQKQQWHSSLIVDRINKILIKTSSGKLYKLEGKLSIENMLRDGFSQELCEKFQDGFPDNWKETLSFHMPTNFLEPIVIIQGTNNTNYSDSSNNSNMLVHQEIQESQEIRGIRGIQEIQEIRGIRGIREIQKIMQIL